MSPIVSDIAEHNLSVLTVTQFGRAQTVVRQLLAYPNHADIADYRYRFVSEDQIRGIHAEVKRRVETGHYNDSSKRNADRSCPHVAARLSRFLQGTHNLSHVGD